MEPQEDRDKAEPSHTIGPEELQFLEVPFLKPTCKNPAPATTIRPISKGVMAGPPGLSAPRKAL